jgi:opacity protein-like surface antigen
LFKTGSHEVFANDDALGGCEKMMRISMKPLLAAAALAALPAAAFAQAASPWDLKPDTGYAYDKEGKTQTYKMGTNNAGVLLKGAKKVPRGTLFFIGQNGQLYMRTGPYLEGDGKFMFGSN